MKYQIQQIIYHPLFSGSVLMIIGSNIINGINYIYHLIMGRLLGPANYGELVSLISLIGLLGIIPASLSLSVVKYISSAKSADEISALTAWFYKKTFIFVSLLFLLIVIFSPMISSFLRIDNLLSVILSGGVLLFSLPAVLNRSVLQGLLRFKQMIGSILIENSTKLLLGVLVVYVGLSVPGVISALMIASFLGWILARHFIYDYLGKKYKSYTKIKQIFSYSIPVLLQSVSITSLYSTDLVLVKHFFSPQEAGLYGALSTLGKIIFFGAGPISTVMFPIIAQRQASGRQYLKVFIYSLILTSLLSFAILVVYWLFPKFAVYVLYGSSYLQAANLLVYFGIFMALFSLSSLFINYHLSLGQTKVVVLPLLAAIVQIIGIWQYHDSLFSTILVSIVVNSLLLFSLFVYFAYENQIGFNHSASIQTRENYSKRLKKS